MYETPKYTHMYEKRQNTHTCTFVVTCKRLAFVQTCVTFCLFLASLSTSFYLNSQILLKLISPGKSRHKSTPEWGKDLRKTIPMSYL